MVLNRTVDPLLERLIMAWHDTEAIRDMPELFTEDKLVQIANAAMAAIEEAWEALGHSRIELKSASQTLVARGKLENWAGKKHVTLD